MRWLNKIYARLMGYFWLPCPVCGRMFGGHECGIGSLDNHVVCNDARCTNDAVIRNLNAGIPQMLWFNYFTNRPQENIYPINTTIKLKILDVE